LIIGETFNFQLEGKFIEEYWAQTSWAKNFEVVTWIDLNYDGVFEDDEILINVVDQTETVNQEVLIPDSVSPGVSRARIMVSFFAEALAACEADSYSSVNGEVEEYCLTLLPKPDRPTGGPPPSDKGVRFFPNPVVDVLNIELLDSVEQVYNVSLWNLNGARVLEERINVPLGAKQFAFDFSKVAPGLYLLSLLDSNNQEMQSLRVLKSE